MTKEQFEALQPYEKHLMSCYKNHELHNMLNKEVRAVEIIYNQFGYRLDNRNCAHCVLRMCEILGELYSTYKEQINKEKEDEETKQRQDTAISEKGTRPCRQNTDGSTGHISKQSIKKGTSRKVQ